MNKETEYKLEGIEIAYHVAWLAAVYEISSEELMEFLINKLEDRKKSA
ncbi:MAG: hypothetical protein O7D95_06205 [Betaproteobacteria bacterium]|nr:hypothetical protein [Betaproteobacteria bacterium]